MKNYLVRISFFVVILTSVTFSSFKVIPNTTRRIQNLNSFAKMYGYARWFHPSDEASDIDWDKFAILGIKKVENIQSDKALRDSLFILFSPIIQGLQINNANKKGKLDIVPLTPPSPSKHRIVAWQHYGVHLGKRSNIYHSARTNRQKKGTYSSISKFKSDLTAFRGQEIKLSGYCKISPTEDGKATFYLCPLQKSEYRQKTALLLTRNSIAINTEKWQQYELTCTINDKVDFLNFGCAVEGDITLWGDNFELSVKNKQGIWEPIDSINMGFEVGKINDTDNDWYSDEQMHSITLSKEDTYSGDYAVKATYTGKIFETAPAFGEFINEPIGNNLSCIIPLTLYDYHKHTYPKSNSIALNQLNAAISSITISDQFDMHTNLASIIITWNVFQHFYPYFDVVKTDWNEALLTALSKAYSNHDKKDCTITLKEMIAKLKDGHGVVYGEKMFHLPIRTELIENKVVITGTQDDQLKIGDIIKKFNGIDAIEMLQKTEKMVSGSPQLKTHRALNVLGSGYYADTSLLTIERNNKQISIAVAKGKGVKNLFFNKINELKCAKDTIRELESNIFYVNMRNCTNEFFISNLPRLKKAKSIIYDYRWGGRLSLIKIVPYLIEKPVNSPWWMIPQVIYPNGKNWQFDKTNWTLEPKSSHLQAKTIVLTAPSVVSSGETGLGLLRHYHLVTTVGTQTAGCNGNTNWIILPNKIAIMWTGMKVLKQDESQHHLLGYIPDFPVKKTIAAVLKGKDEVLNKAIQVAKDRY